MNVKLLQLHDTLNTICLFSFAASGWLQMQQLSFVALCSSGVTFQLHPRVLPQALRVFDTMLSEVLTAQLPKGGVNVVSKSQVRCSIL